MVILGAEAQSVAVAWQVYAITHSALDLGYTGLALFLPGLFFMLAAGHVADRYDRRKIILCLLWVAGGLYGGVAVAVVERQRMREWTGLADLCGAGGDWVGASFQRAGGERDAAEPGAEGTFCECGDVGRDDLSDCEYVGAGGGWDAVYAAAGGGAGAVERCGDCLCVYAGDAAGIHRAGGDDSDADGARRRRRRSA